MNACILIHTLVLYKSNPTGFWFPQNDHNNSIPQTIYDFSLQAKANMSEKTHYFLIKVPHWIVGKIISCSLDHSIKKYYFRDESKHLYFISDLNKFVLGLMSRPGTFSSLLISKHPPLYVCVCVLFSFVNAFVCPHTCEYSMM